MGCCQSFEHVAMSSMMSNHKKDDLSEEELEMLKFTWNLMQNYGFKNCGIKFMIRIFTEHPHLKNLWKFARDLHTVEQYQTSPAVQVHGEKVFGAVNMAISHLSDFDALIPILIRLGLKHYGYGAREEHLPIIGAALINTLADVIESEFTDEMKHSWTKLYKNIEVYMTIGMRQAAQANANNPSVSSVGSQRDAQRNSITIYNSRPVEEAEIDPEEELKVQKKLELNPENPLSECPLTMDDITEIRESWSRVREIGFATVGTNMMIILFTKYPTVKNVWSFAKDLKSETDVREHPAVKIHGERLFQAINMTVSRLREMETLKQILFKLGYNHFNYGAREQHFPFVAQALFDTLESGLKKEDFGENTKESWIKYLRIVEENMALGLKKAEQETEKKRVAKPNETVVSAADIKKIRECWLHVVRGGLTVFGVDMMRRLFTDYKEIKSIWKFSEGLDRPEQITSHPMVRKHGERLFTSLDLLISKLEDLAFTQAMLQQLGFKHFLYGARPEHFPFIANALMETLGNGLQSFLDEPRKAAWGRLYEFIKEQMIAGMIQAEHETRKF